MNTIGKRKNKIYIITIIMLMILGGTATMGIIGYSKNYGYANKLIVSMDNNDFEKFNQLLEQKGNIDSKRSIFSFAKSNDMSPLRYACWLNKFDFVEPLLKKGANPNLTDNQESILTLCLMNAKKDTEKKLLNTMKLLIEYDTDVNYKDKSGISVLSRAELYLDVVNNTISDDIKDEIFKLLIDSGAQK